MKYLSFLIFTIFILSSCGQSQKEIDAAKKELLNPEVQVSSNTPDTSWSGTEVSTEDLEVTESDSEPDLESDVESSVSITPRTAEQYLSFDSIDESKLSSGEVEITGTTSKWVDKIQVLFSNRASDYPNDDYVLQTFKSWDDIFRYVASSRNKVLDFGENQYTFRAFSGKEISETRVVLRVSEDDAFGSERQLIGSEDDTVLIDLPTSSKYGEPIKLGEKTFTYDQIKWLEVGKEVFEKPSCAELTDFLQERITTWFYWNTCRDLVKDSGIYYNVVRLDGDDYVYERHYVDFIHGFYGTYELERGQWVTKETIAEKNTELKEAKFENVDIVDGLMRDIITS